MSNADLQADTIYVFVPESPDSFVVNCEEQGDVAISSRYANEGDCFASLAMTGYMVLLLECINTSS